jgi:hypothetical protein
MSLRHEEPSSSWTIQGEVFFHLVDSRTGKVLLERSQKNLVVLDGGVLAAMLFAAGATGTSGLTMLAVGTGATGPLLSPDAPDTRQRHLNAEIRRKPFSSVTFRTAAGAVSAVPTHVVDFTTIFGEGEAVGPLNEMGLMRTFYPSPALTKPVPSVFPVYDPTIDLTQYDIEVNYLTFSVVSKPSTSVLTLTWRLTF